LNPVPEGLLAPALDQVTIVHDLLPLRYPSEYPRQQYYFRHYLPAVLRASRAVIAVSEATRKDMLAFYGMAPERVQVVLSGYDPQRFAPEPAGGPSTEPYLLYVGNVMPHKNLGRLIEAFAAVSRRRPVALKLRGWGRSRHVRDLRARIAHLGLEPRVDWQPYAPDDELPALYRGARALVLPSLHEGFGLTALEAMACGTPVVASRESSLPEVVGDAAALVDPLDVASIAAGINQVLADDGLRALLRERGLLRAQRFSWEATAQAVRRVISAVSPGDVGLRPPRGTTRTPGCTPPRSPAGPD